MQMHGAVSVLVRGRVKSLKWRLVFTKDQYSAHCSSSLCLKPYHESSALGSPGRTSIRPPPRGRFGRRSRRNSYDFALSVREGEDDFAPFFGDFRNLLSVLLAPVSRFFACLQQTLTVALMIANGDTPTTTRCLQKHDIITLIGNYITVHIPLINPVITSVDVIRYHAITRDDNWPKWLAESTTWTM